MTLLDGFGTTLEIFFLTLIFALPLGLIISFGSMSKFKVIKWPIKMLIWIIRGTPLMLQIIALFYVPGLLFGYQYPTMNLFGYALSPRFVCVLTAFLINYSCYFSEIFRGGIESIPKGQYEAGQVLGLTKIQTFFKVVLMQVVKRIVPPMSNEIITLVKDTSLARVISEVELIWFAQEFARTDGLIWPLFYSGVFYLVFCGILTLIFGYIEKKLNYYRG
ncbi:MAG: amino acid ABC transporter permease [Ruminococcaceae bacterium]|nr:amino acid ABC transporter permease [Oscillospiraceae bacterium]